MALDNEISFSPERLAACSVRDTEQALRNFDLLLSHLGADAFSRLLPDMLNALGRAGDPDMALNNLERFVAALDDTERFVSECRSRAGFLISLITVFGASRFLSSYLIAAADASIELLSDPGFLNTRADRKALFDRLRTRTAGTTDEQNFYRGLRLFRKEQMLRIALRDLLGKADLADTVSDLSDLAELTLQEAYERIDAELGKKYGRPLSGGPDNALQPAGFAVIAMGKLGGRELNFSSDIDLIYVYSSDGETEGIPAPDGTVKNRISNHQYFIKLAEKLTAAIGRKTEDGFVFRVDLRLRPEGQRGPLAQSLGGYEIYYESWGQTWERAALIKARPVAGDEAVGREFLERVLPFVFRKYLDYGAIAEIRDMKQKINREVQLKGSAERDVKLGSGGIREVEFVIQALQLIYGGRDRGLREKSSLKALHRLSQKGLLTYQETGDLFGAYVFLRNIEHRIQMLDDLQTQLLPDGEAELRSLARRSAYLEPGREAEALLRDFTLHTRKVRDIYDNLFSQAGEEPEGPLPEYAHLLDPETSEQEAVTVLARYGFRDPAKAYRNVVLLREGPAFVHQTPRSRRQFNEIFPVVLNEIIASPDPDMALNHLESYLAAQGSWDAFQSILTQDPLSVKILTAVFANSEYFSRMLVSSPGLLDQLLDRRSFFGFVSAQTLRSTLAAAVKDAEGITEKLDALRRFKHREEIRIGMADLISAVPLPTVSRWLSRVAEACLDAALRLAVVEIGKRYAAECSATGLAVIGAGKLGGRELMYGSDLDILFVFSEERAGPAPPGITAFEYFSKIAEKTLSYLTTMTREGFAYRVDTRLRPTGSKGPLVQSLDAFRSYYSSSAETWERQALINARFVAGDRRVGSAFCTEINDLVYRERDRKALAGDVRAMRRRMEEELGKEDAAHYNVKQGVGGLVDIEFLVQFLQLVYGNRERQVRVPGACNALHALRKKGLITGEDLRMLKQSYFFLRTLESRMRIVSNQATNRLSRDPDQLLTLARRMGYADDAEPAGRKLLGEYERIRTAVRAAFERLLG